MIDFGDGESLPCEIRIRKRVEGDWETDLFRPFPTARSLAERIQQVRPNWRNDEKLVALVDHLLDENNIGERLCKTITRQDVRSDLGRGLFARDGNQAR